MKVCGTCKLELPLDAFSKNSTRKDGLQNRCRACKKIWYDNYYKTNPKERARLYANRDAVYANNRAYTDSLKSVPCVDCGMKYPPYVMQFDHLDGKEFNISTSLWRSRESLDKEIQKCEVVCANCHMERTHQRRTWV